MPEASQELRELMQHRFGSLDSESPSQFLESRGYTLSRDWTWSKPGISTLKDMQRDEFDCLLFLVHEWDYGSLAPCA